MPHLFNVGAYQLHSGRVTPFKIDCDGLGKADWRALALLVATHVHFGVVEGVPTGGLALAHELERFVEPDNFDTLLIVDDVLTTGASMEEQRAGRDAVGIVVFARGECPEWAEAIFTCRID